MDHSPRHRSPRSVGMQRVLLLAAASRRPRRSSPLATTPAPSSGVVLAQPHQTLPTPPPLPSSAAERCESEPEVGDSREEVWREDENNSTESMSDGDGDESSTELSESELSEEEESERYRRRYYDSPSDEEQAWGSEGDAGIDEPVPLPAQRQLHLSAVAVRRAASRPAAPEMSSAAARQPQQQLEPEPRRRRRHEHEHEPQPRTAPVATRRGGDDGGARRRAQRRLAVAKRRAYYRAKRRAAAKGRGEEEEESPSLTPSPSPSDSSFLLPTPTPSPASSFSPRARGHAAQFDLPPPAPQTPLRATPSPPRSVRARARERSSRSSPEGQAQFKAWLQMQPGYVAAQLVARRSEEADARFNFGSSPHSAMSGDGASLLGNRDADPRQFQWIEGELVMRSSPESLRMSPSDSALMSSSVAWPQWPVPPAPPRSANERGAFSDTAAWSSREQQHQQRRGPVASRNAPLGRAPRRRRHQNARRSPPPPLSQSLSPHRVESSLDTMPTRETFSGIARRPPSAVFDSMLAQSLRAEDELAATLDGLDLTVTRSVRGGEQQPPAAAPGSGSGAAAAAVLSKAAACRHEEAEEEEDIEDVDAKTALSPALKAAAEADAAAGEARHSPQSPRDVFDPSDMSYENLSLLDYSRNRKADGLSFDELLQLRCIRFRQASTGASCSVCLDSFDTGDHAVVLKCAHRFHAKCIVRWLTGHHHCPNCRISLRKSDRRTSGAVQRRARSTTTSSSARTGASQRGHRGSPAAAPAAGTPSSGRRRGGRDGGAQRHRPISALSSPGMAASLIHDNGRWR